jgi:hypothetical protein
MYTASVRLLCLDKISTAIKGLGDDEGPKRVPQAAMHDKNCSFKQHRARYEPSSKEVEIYIELN